MPFDGTFLYQLNRELNAALQGARVDKIHQPSGDELVFLMRTKNGNRRLVMNLSASPRLYLSQTSGENPAVPPRFCTFLRKYLTNAKFVGVEGYGFERVTKLLFDSHNEMGDEIRLGLVLELISGGGNAVLTAEDGHIMDALRHSDLETQARLIQPGAIYRLPDAQPKLDPTALRPGELADAVLAKHDELWHALLTTVAGLSPALARELASAVTEDVTLRCETIPGAKVCLAAVLSSFVSLLTSPGEPSVMKKEGKMTDFSWMELRYGGAEIIACDTCSEAVDLFFAEKRKQEQTASRTAELSRFVNTLRSRLARKIEARRKDAEKSRDAEKYRVWGELIKANLFTIEKGAAVVDLANYYDDMKPTRIPLDPSLSAADNANKYFKEYKKRRTAAGMLDGLIADGMAELDYIDSVAEALSRAETAAECDAIRAELTESGYLKNKTGKKPVKISSAPLKFTAPSGCEVLVGRNNSENDQLTLRTAEKNDYWFHTKGLHGSHVILRCGNTDPDEADLLFAAEKAAYYSKGRKSAQVPVDFTRVRYVKKPSGAKPGMVIYTNQSTAYIKPKE